MDCLSQIVLNIDDKSRLRLPKKILSQFPNGKVFARYGSGGCIELMSEEENNDFTKFCNSHKSFGNSRAQMAIRLLGASVRELVYDAQDRFTLDNEAKAFMGLKKEYVYINYGSTFEIWAKEKWDEFSKPVIEDKNEFDDCLSTLDSLRALDGKIDNGI